MMEMVAMLLHRFNLNFIHMAHKAASQKFIDSVSPIFIQKHSYISKSLSIHPFPFFTTCSFYSVFLLFVVYIYIYLRVLLQAITCFIQDTDLDLF